MPSALTMNRTGQFRVHAVGPFHCGIANDVNIKYHMTCECRPKLDGRGFLFEQLNVDKFFQSHKTTRLSCEKFVIQCAKKLMAQIHRENPTCEVTKMTLTLSPEPHAASMTYTWEP